MFVKFILIENAAFLRLAIETQNNCVVYYLLVLKRKLYVFVVTPTSFWRNKINNGYGYESQYLK